MKYLHVYHNDHDNEWCVYDEIVTDNKYDRIDVYNLGDHVSDAQCDDPDELCGIIAKNCIVCLVGLACQLRQGDMIRVSNARVAVVLEEEPCSASKIECMDLGGEVFIANVRQELQLIGHMDVLKMLDSMNDKLRQ
jgi:hypothetical protein